MNQSISNRINTLTQKVGNLTDEVNSLTEKLKEVHNAISAEPLKVTTKWYRKLNLLQVIGFLILFLSWVSENLVKSRLEDKKNEFQFRSSMLSQTQDMVFAQEIAAKQFLALNSLSQGGDSLIKANTARYLSLYCQDYIMLKKLTYSTLNLDKDFMSDEAYSDSTITLNRDSTNIARHFELKKIDSLNYYANLFLSAEENNEFYSEIEALRRYNQKVSEDLTGTDDVFIALYILGSAMLAIDYLRRTVAK